MSYNVLAHLTAELVARRAALEAKGAIVPFSFEERTNALEFRKEMIQIQVGLFYWQPKTKQNWRQSGSSALRSAFVV